MDHPAKNETFRETETVITLATADLVVLAVFAATLFGLGFSAKLRELSVFQFVTAGRQLTLPWFVATLVTTWYGGVLGIGESVSYYGIGTWLLLGVPYYIFAGIYAARMAGQVREADQFSIPERVAHRWGKGAGLVSGSLVFLLAVPAAHVLMLATLVQGLTGWGLPIAIPVAVLCGTAFLYKGGLLADVRVGMLAFVLMYVGFAVMVGFSIGTYGLGSLAEIKQPNALSFTGGQQPLAILSFFILGAWTIVDPGFHQRVASAASPEVGRRGVWVAIAFWMLFDILTVTAGMFALRLLPEMPANPLLIFPALAQAVLPAGLKGIFLCGLLGTIVSALVGYSLVAGSSMGREILGRAFDLDDAKTRAAIRLGIAISSLLAALLSFAVQSVVALWYSWAGAVVGALLMPTVVAYSSRKVRWRPGAVVFSQIAGFTVAVSWMVFGLRTNNPLLEVEWMGQRFGLGTLIPGLVVSGIVLGWESLIQAKRKSA